ncbi:hypothetical protein ACFCX4_08980 [Kitasatospora sp. NPDC056327]|uniref:hypothetical protein n=1 Tax=Kitasatospora sp. NPDC056327 TaxID=3345785 RepID=UPI0035DF1495
MQAYVPPSRPWPPNADARRRPDFRFALGVLAAVSLASGAAVGYLVADKDVSDDPAPGPATPLTALVVDCRQTPLATGGLAAVATIEVTNNTDVEQRYRLLVEGKAFNGTSNGELSGLRYIKPAGRLRVEYWIAPPGSSDPNKCVFLPVEAKIG